MHRRLAVLVLAGLAALTGGGCGGGGPSASDQGRSIAETAGLPKDVADFFALATTGLTATYRVTRQTTDTSGQPLQLTTTQRPPDTRFDAFHSDGSVDSTIATGGRSYQCTMQAMHWDCGELGTSASSSGQAFDADTVKHAIDAFKARTADYDFRTETRTIANVTAHCLVTTRKPGHESNSALGATATLCLSPEGVILSVEIPTGSLTATEYSTTIPDDAFNLPAEPTTTTTTAAN